MHACIFDFMLAHNMYILNDLVFSYVNGDRCVHFKSVSGVLYDIFCKSTFG